MRLGRPPTYTAEERSAVIKAALSHSAELDLPFASWTLDRPGVCLAQVDHISPSGSAMVIPSRRRDSWLCY